jgi:hypothetical protein
VQVATTSNGLTHFLGLLADHKMVLKIDLLLRVNFVAIWLSARMMSFWAKAGSTTNSPFIYITPINFQMIQQHLHLHQFLFI